MDPPPNVSAEEWKNVSDEKINQKRKFGMLSSNSKVVVVERAGHHIQLDDPDTVVDAIKATLTAAGKHAKLTP